MRGGLRIGKLFGIPVYLHFSWFAIFALVTTSLALGYFPFYYKGWAPWQHWAVGVATSLLFFASVIAHELSHSLVSRSYGIPVKSMTLFIFGGVARISREATQPRRELLMALAGPLSSLAMAGFFGLLFLGVSHRQEQLAALSWWLMRINVLLAAFNLVPGFPLDGGRVLRALVWGATGNYLRATRIATLAGRGIGYGMILLGLGAMLGLKPFVFVGGFPGGLWLAFIGWFLENAASASYQQVTLREALHGLTAAQVMSQDFSLVPSSLTLEQVVDGFVLPKNVRSVLVAERGRVVGMLPVGAIRAVPPRRWGETPVERVMLPLAAALTASAEEPALSLLERMEEGELSQIAVVRGGEVVGVVSRDHLWGLAHLRRGLGRRPWGPAGE